MLARRSIRLPDIGEAEGAGAATEARLSDRALNSKSSVARRGGSCTGSDGAGSIAAGRTKAKVRVTRAIAAADIKSIQK